MFYVEKYKSKYKILLDFIYNILASFISVGILQLLLYPLLARIFTSNEYGQLLTIMGIINTISSSLGSTLNNTRLIQNTRYLEENITGDFNIILLGTNIIGFIITIIIGIFFIEYNTVTVILLSILVVLISIKSYLAVGYRLKINYKLILLSNVITGIGYLVGIAVVYITAIWPLAFIIAEIFNIIFLLFTVKLQNEPYKKTKLFNQTLTKYTILIITGLLGNLLLYLDRLIIYPVMGGKYVTIYTVASVFGKSFGLVMTPIAGVLLSYFSQKNYNMSKVKFWKINFCVFVSTILFLLASIIIAPWFTGVLYPTVIVETSKYIFIANLAAIISVATSIIQPSILKFAPTYWQVVKEVIYGVIYIGLGVLLLRKDGLIGFCWAAIIANCIKLVFLCAIGMIEFKE